VVHLESKEIRDMNEKERAEKAKKIKKEIDEVKTFRNEGWMTISPERLPADLLTGNYEFNILGDSGMLRNRAIEEVLDKLTKGYCCYYRERVESKTIEDLANDYANSESISSLNSTLARFIMTVQEDIKAAFIAGSEAK
jgi:hypothetical protein